MSYDVLGLHSSLVSVEKCWVSQLFFRLPLLPPTPTDFRIDAPSADFSFFFRRDDAASADFADPSFFLGEMMRRAPILPILPFFRREDAPSADS